MRPIVFDHDLASGRDDVVLVHLNHRLVQMACACCAPRSGRTAPASGCTGRPCVWCRTALLETPAVFAHARLVVIGGDSQRLHEEIITAGGEIREGRFRRLNVGEVQAALGAAMATGRASDQRSSSG